MAKSTIHIKPENKGKFTAKAKAKGKGVQEFANQVLANKERYSASTVKQANFAHVFGGRNYEYGGEPDIYDIMPYSYYSMADAAQGFPEGGQVKPVYTNNPNDPRLKAYQDSLKLFKQTDVFRKNLPSDYEIRKINHPDNQYETHTYRELFNKKLLPDEVVASDYTIIYPLYKKPTTPIIYRPREETTTLTPIETKIQSSSPLSVELRPAQAQSAEERNYSIALPRNPMSETPTLMRFKTREEMEAAIADFKTVQAYPASQTLGNNYGSARYTVPLEYITSELEKKKEYGGYAESEYPYSVQDDQMYNSYDDQGNSLYQTIFENLGDSSRNSVMDSVPIPNISSDIFVNKSSDPIINDDFPTSKNPMDLLSGLAMPKEQGSNKVPKTAGAKADIAGAAFNAAGTAMQALAPPDSKFGKAMQKGNSFAQAAEPLRALDMAVPGLGTAAVEAARLAGAITGGVQAKNEEIQTERIEDTTAYLNRYDNMNFSKMNQGNYLSRYGSNIRSYQQGGQTNQLDSLVEEIFMDFDNWLSGGGDSEKKLEASEGTNVNKNNKQQEFIYDGGETEETEVYGSQEPFKRVIGFINEYKDLDPVMKAKLAQKKASPIWRKSNQQIEEENKQYDYVAKRLLDTLPKGKGKEKQLAKYDSLTPRERQIIEESKYADRFKKPIAYAANRRLNEISDLPIRQQFNPDTLKEIETLYQKDGRLPFTAGTPLSYINPANVIGNLSPLGDLAQGNYEEAAAKTALTLGLGAIGGGARGNLLPFGGTETEVLNVMKSAKASNATMRTQGHRIIKELNSEEGKRRLKNQFHEADPNLTEDQLNYLVKARLEEVEKSLIYNPGRLVQDKSKEEIIDFKKYERYFPEMNAHYSPTPLYNFVTKEAPEQLFPNKPDLNFFGISLRKDTGTEKFLNPNIEPGYITLGRGLEKNVKVLDHEIGHSIQKGGELPIDAELSDLIDSGMHYHTSSLPKGVLEDIYRIVTNPLDGKSFQIQNDLNYFINAGGRTYKNETYPFLREQRRKMLETGVIKDIYEEITVPKLIQARLKAATNKGKNFEEGDRLIKMVAPWKYGKLKDLMNKAPVVAPLMGIGTLTGSQTPEMKSGGKVTQEDILNDFEIYLNESRTKKRYK